MNEKFKLNKKLAELLFPGSSISDIPVNGFGVRVSGATFNFFDWSKLMPTVVLHDIGYEIGDTEYRAVHKNTGHKGYVQVHHKDLKTALIECLIEKLSN